MTDDIIRTASLSKDGVYRFALHRMWGNDLGRAVVWIMLNPSTADATVDDPTIRRCIGFTRYWGYYSMTVVNLFPLRATDPTALAGHVEPKDILKLNLSYIESECVWNNPALVVCAWGTHGALFKRNKLVIDKLIALGVNLNVIGLTEDRHPKHPLYLKKDLKPVRWNGK